jgi:hypothetical protein
LGGRDEQRNTKWMNRDIRQEEEQNREGERRNGMQ